MKTRYWKQAASNAPDWKLEGGKMFVSDLQTNWFPSTYSSLQDLLAEECGDGLHECTADGTPLSDLAAEPADRLTLAEFDAFAARVRATLALLEKEGER